MKTTLGIVAVVVLVGGFAWLWSSQPQVQAPAPAANTPAPQASQPAPTSEEDMILSDLGTVDEGNTESDLNGSVQGDINSL